LQLLLRLGIALLIITIFFLANHIGSPLANQVLRIFGSIVLFQMTVWYFLLRENARQIQAMIDNGIIKDDFDRRGFYRAAALGFSIGLGLSVILYLPKVIALGWVWIIAYLVGFVVIFITLDRIFKIRNHVNGLKETAFQMSEDAAKERKSNKKRK